MKIFIIVAAIILSGCGIFKSPSDRAITRAKKHWDKIQEELLKHPEIADSLQLVRHDTIKVDALAVHIEPKTDVADSALWDSAFFGEVDSLVDNVVKAKEPEKPKAVVKLQDRICPTLNYNENHMLKVYNSKLTMWVPIRVNVQAKGGKLSVDINTDPIKMPEPQVIKSIEFKAVETHFLKDMWFWVSMALLLILVAFLAISLRK